MTMSDWNLLSQKSKEKTMHSYKMGKLLSEGMAGMQYVIIRVECYNL